MEKRFIVINHSGKHDELFSIVCPNGDVFECSLNPFDPENGFGKYVHNIEGAEFEWGVVLNYIYDNIGGSLGQIIDPTLWDFTCVNEFAESRLPESFGHTSETFPLVGFRFIHDEVHEWTERVYEWTEAFAVQPEMLKQGYSMYPVFGYEINQQ